MLGGFCATFLGPAAPAVAGTHHGTSGWLKGRGLRGIHAAACWNTCFAVQHVFVPHSSKHLKRVTVATLYE